MSDFQADTNQIDDAAGRLGGVAGVLKVSYSGANPSALGFPSAEAAVTNFVTAWAVGGEILSRAVTEIQGGLQNAAANYSNAEQTNWYDWQEVWKK